MAKWINTIKITFLVFAKANKDQVFLSLLFIKQYVKCNSTEA